MGQVEKISPPQSWLDEFLGREILVASSLLVWKGLLGGKVMVRDGAGIYVNNPLAEDIRRIYREGGRIIWEHPVIPSAGGAFEFERDKKKNED